MKAKKIRYPDGFAFERGLENLGYTSDSERHYRSTWRGFPINISIWSKSGRGNPSDLLLFQLADTYCLFKQVDIVAIFDGDEDEAEVDGEID